MKRKVDEQKLNDFMGNLVGHMTGAMVCHGVWMGDELGLYRKMAEAGQVTAEALAKSAQCHPRLVREWLDGQSAAGLTQYEPSTNTYTLSPEAETALADEQSPVFVARAMNSLASFYRDMEKIKSAFEGKGGMAWGEHDPTLFKGTEWLFRTGYRTLLPSEWIPALDGVQLKLEKGSLVADVGCGHGASVVAMAEAFPNSTFRGFDYHKPSIEVAKERAREAGVQGHTSFAVATAKNYPGQYDLICFFDCLHDMGDPVGIASYARQRLEPDGTVLLVEPYALDGEAHNIHDNPMAALYYGASYSVCVPTSLSQEVGKAMGAQAGAEAMREVFEAAGFTRFRKATETPFNLVLEARP